MPNQQQPTEQGRYFSPEEIRGIRGTIRAAMHQLGDNPANIDLVRDLAKKERELTQAIIAKSTWDKRFKKKEGKQQ